MEQGLTGFGLGRQLLARIGLLESKFSIWILIESLR